VYVQCATYPTTRSADLLYVYAKYDWIRWLSWADHLINFFRPWLAFTVVAWLSTGSPSWRRSKLMSISLRSNSTSRTCRDVSNVQQTAGREIVRLWTLRRRRLGEVERSRRHEVELPIGKVCCTFDKLRERYGLSTQASSWIWYVRLFDELNIWTCSTRQSRIPLYGCTELDSRRAKQALHWISDEKRKRGRPQSTLER